MTNNGNGNEMKIPCYIQIPKSKLNVEKLGSGV